MSVDRNQIEVQAAKTDPTLRETIRRFAPEFRRRLWKFTTLSVGHRDLLTSFPAAAVAIVVQPQASPLRLEAMRLVGEGASLHTIARTLQLPLWYRRLPPETFDTPPPRAPAGTGIDAAFGMRVLNMVPQDPVCLPRWLETVMAARAAVNDEFAIWLAGQCLATRNAATVPLQALTLYGWHSLHPELGAGQFILTPWRPAIGLGRAAQEARYWLLTVLQECCVCEPAGEAGQSRTWHAYGYDIVPLTTPEAILDEARAMRNCLAHYVGPVAWGHSRLYSFRRDGCRVATLEVRPARGRIRPCLRQFCGPRNAKPPQDAIEAARAWIMLERSHLVQDFLIRFDRFGDTALERLVWGPYAEQKARQGLADCNQQVPSIATILRDCDALGELAK